MRVLCNCGRRLLELYTHTYAIHTSVARRAQWFSLIPLLSFGKTCFESASECVVRTPLQYISICIRLDKHLIYTLLQKKEKTVRNVNHKTHECYFIQHKHKKYGYRINWNKSNVMKCIFLFISLLRFQARMLFLLQLLFI